MTQVTYPRGRHPNSLAALKKHRTKTQFNGDSAVAANQRSYESRVRLKSFREIDAETTEPEERHEMLRALKEMAKHGDIRAMELYLKISGEDINNTKIEVNAAVVHREPLANLSIEDIKEMINDG